MKILLSICLFGVVYVSNALYSPSDDVIDLTAANFNSKVINSDDVWMVEFYAPWCGHCKALAPEWKKAATALKGIVKVGAVDMDQHQSVGAPYNVRGFPTIKVFGLNKNKAEDYNGARTAQSIVDTAMRTLRSVVDARLSGKKSSGGSSGGGSRSGGGSGGSGNAEDVIELTDSNFEDKVLNSDDMWLVEFFAPWCGHCKNLAPEWQSAATQLKGKVKLGALDATVHTVMASRYGIDSYPVIKLFLQWDKENPVDYEGVLKKVHIVGFALSNYVENFQPPDIVQVRGYPTIKVFGAGKDKEAVDYDGGRTAGDIVNYALDKVAENIPPPEVKELIEQNVLSEACDEHQLCVISFLPHILDCQSKCRNDYIKTLLKLGEKYKKKMWGWVWTEAGKQPEVEEALGIGGFGYPAMAAVNSRKMKYATLRGSFSENGINDFLRELAVGRGSTAPIKNAKLPNVQKSDPWDGKDGELPVEEDIDLSDVTLDDLDKDEL